MFFFRNKALCGIGTFRSIYNKVKYPADIITNRDGETKFLSYEECNTKYGNINQEEYLSLKVVIRYSLARYKARLENINISRPIIPTLMECIFLTEKGCNKWTKIFRQSTSNKSIVRTEENWNTSLGTNQGVRFWDRCYQNIRDFYYDNKLKMFYYMIIRGTLKTNRIVHHHVINISPECTFCRESTETILHLFWSCRVTSAFLYTIQDYILMIFPNFDFATDQKEFIFGRRDEHIDSLFNFIIIHIKYFIWISRCDKKIPNTNAFYNWFKRELRIKKKCFEDSNRMLFLSTIDI
ncbi:MAG TPA: hypothetical protein DDY16_01570 [Tenacibaculum sp.]|nr:hypothetical protein [Tenacibaculum sp.]